MPIDLSVFDELTAMSDGVALAFNEDGSKTEQVKKEPSKKEEKKPEDEKKPAEKDEEQGEEVEEAEEAEEQQDETEETTEEAPEEEDEKEETNEDDLLRDKLVGLLSLLQNESEPRREVPKQEAPKPEAPKPRVFVTEEELDNLTADKLNEKLNLVYQSAQQDAMRAVTQTIGKVVTDAIDVRMTVSEFYRDNPDLVKYKPVVQLVVTSMQRKHPEWGLDKIIGELGKEVRTTLGLTEKKEAKKKPGFAKQPGGSRKTPITPQKKPTGMQAEIRELLERRAKNGY